MFNVEACKLNKFMVGCTVSQIFRQNSAFLILPKDLGQADAAIS